MPPSSSEPNDLLLMRQALAEATQALALTEPNPRVGCVISREDGAGGIRIIGRGHTQQAGGPHAEVMALRNAAQRGEAVAGATVHVTLEPCAHHGRTPPCCDALIAAGVGRVVYAVEDPFPQVAGRGAQRLREAGIAVVHGPLAAEARELNIGFFSRVLRARPWVRMKVAVSVDGRSALDNGASQWITGTAARTDGHAWRKRASAVLTGVGTVLDDDPRLDVRLVETPRQPLRVVVDSRLDMPLAARILPPPGAVLVAAAEPLPERLLAFKAAGIEVTLLPGSSATGQAKVDLPALLGELAGRGVNELHVEAGAKLNGSFLRAGLVDELLVYMAPKLLGEGRPLAALGPLLALGEAPDWRFHAVDRIGDDLRLLLRPMAGWQP